MDDAVDAGAAVGPVDLVVPDGHPRVLVGVRRDRRRHGPTRRVGDGSSGRVVIAHRRTRRAAAVRARGRLLDSDGRVDRRPSAPPASQPAHSVAALRDVRIPVARRARAVGQPLAARAAAEGRPRPFPAILEMIPYGKDDWRRQRRGARRVARGARLRPCRLDVRGTGSSPGIALDEYTADETRDGYDAVEWLAAQPWCNGEVGMWGICYGGFTAIQVAMLRPPHLRAIVPVMATDDRYTDDVHYLGGCVTASELCQYAVSLVGDERDAARRRPSGRRLADEWRERLEPTPVWLFEWLRQQHDGPYWRQGSLAPDYDATTPMLLHRRLDGRVCRCGVPDAGALHDAPRRTLIGNWVHGCPTTPIPGRTSTGSTRSSASSTAG